MLVAALRTDNPLGGAPLTYDDAIEVFALQGLGEISAAKLLDLENRRQLVWADPVTREWALETAAIRVRKEAETKAAARAAEAAAAAAASAQAAAAAEERAAAGGIASGGPSGGTLVFGPPAAQPRRPAGVRAATTRFALPASDRDAGTVVWSEAPLDGAATSSTGSQPSAPVAAHAADVGAWATGAAGARSLGGEASGQPAAGLQQPAAAAPAGVVTRRADRRSALKEHEHRRAAGAARLRVVLYTLLAVATAVVLFVVQRGGF